MTILSLGLDDPLVEIIDANYKNLGKWWKYSNISIKISLLTAILGIFNWMMVTPTSAISLQEIPLLSMLFFSIYTITYIIYTISTAYVSLKMENTKRWFFSILIGFLFGIPIAVIYKWKKGNELETKYPKMEIISIKKSNENKIRAFLLSSEFEEIDKNTFENNSLGAGAGYGDSYNERKVIIILEKNQLKIMPKTRITFTFWRDFISSIILFFIPAILRYKEYSKSKKLFMKDYNNLIKMIKVIDEE